MATPTSIPSSSSGGNGKVTIIFKNHCLLCLQADKPEVVLDLLRRNPQNLRTFQPVIHYLTGTDPTWGQSQKECQKHGLPQMGSFNIPPLCSKCYPLCADIYRLHAELLELQLLIQAKTEEARKIVAQTNKVTSWKGRVRESRRDKFLASLKRDGESPKDVALTLRFVENLHQKTIIAGGKKVIFPSHPPPNFLPLPKQQQIILVPVPAVPPPMEVDASGITCIGSQPSTTSSNVVILPGTSNHEFEDECEEETDPLADIKPEIPPSPPDTIEISITPRSPSPCPAIVQKVEVEETREHNESFEEPPEQTESFGKPPEHTESFEKPLDESESFEKPPEQSESFKEPPEQSKSFKEPPEQTESLEDPQDTITIKEEPPSSPDPPSLQPCDICESPHPPVSLFDHISTSHGITTLHTCATCLKVYISSTRLVNHLGNSPSCQDVNSLSTFLTCTTCPDSPSFLSTNDLYNHVFTYHEPVGNTNAVTTTAGPFKCELCPNQYESVEGLDFHKNVHVATKLRWKVGSAPICTKILGGHDGSQRNGMYLQRFLSHSRQRAKKRRRNCHNPLND